MRFAVFLLILVSIFIFPLADDYAYAVRTLDLDYWAAWVREYRTWNGRWASNLILLLNDELLANIWCYRAAVVLNLLFFYGALNSFFPKKIGALCFLIYLGAAAAFSENFYWLTGAITYTTPIALQLFGLNLLFKKKSCRRSIRSSSRLPEPLPGLVIEPVPEPVDERSRRRVERSRDRVAGRSLCGSLSRLPSGVEAGVEVRAKILTILLISLSSGFNEVAMAVNIFLVIVFIPQLGKRIWIFLLPLVIVSAFTILAPGNDVRSDLFANNHRIFYSFFMSLAQTIRFAGKSIIFLPFPLAMIWIHSKEFKWPIVNKIKAWQLVLIAFGPLFISAFLPYYATGILGQHRTPTVGQFYFIATCLIFPVWFKHQPKLKNRFRSLAHYTQRIPTLTINNSQLIIKRFALIGIIIGFLLLGNTGSLIRDSLSGSIQQNAHLQKSRIEQIENSCQSDQTTLSFAPLDTNALFVIDISQNPDHWININQARYLCPERNNHVF